MKFSDKIEALRLQREARNRDALNNLAFLLGLLALCLLILLPSIRQCHATGGAVVRGLIGLECISR
jgi:hypothetical protein